MTANNTEKYEVLSRDTVVKALFENYESLYAVDAETSAFQCFHQSDSYGSLCLEREGDNFFDCFEKNVAKTVYCEDQEYVRERLSKQALMNGLAKDRFYSFSYRLMINGNPLYHKFRATSGIVEGRPYILIGIRNNDSTFRQDKAQAEKISAMHIKEMNHLEAILASAGGYLEANLSNDTVLEFSFRDLSDIFPESIRDTAEDGSLKYSDFIKQYFEPNVTEDKDKLSEISERSYLIGCFESGEKRASTYFSIKTSEGLIQPCKIIFHLYQDASSKDILVFGVLYDLTEQQRKEKELRELEHELQMIRLRNFTRQMEPHFLYNALASIQEIILEDPTYASELIGDFATHLRCCIRAMENDAPIPFDQELANIKAYVNIEKMRMGDKLNVVYDVRKRDFTILPLSVQPVVENAIRHGIYKRGEKGGSVTIKTSEDDESVFVSVEDNGVGFDVEALQAAIMSGKQDSTGLKNIMFRLDKIMHAAVDIKSRADEGTTITITIPKENKGK